MLTPLSLPPLALVPAIVVAVALLPVVIAIVVVEPLLDESRQVVVVEREHKPRVRIVRVARCVMRARGDGSVVVVVGDIQRVLDAAADHDILTERYSLELGRHVESERRHVRQRKGRMTLC